MAGFLIDTNVVSELTRSEPNLNVVAFLDTQPDIWLSTVVLHELEYGLGLLPAGKRRDELSSIIANLVAEYGDRIIPLERAEAQAAAELRVAAKNSGKVLHLGDALIAGTAKMHALTIASRNITDFDGLGVPIANPWNTF